jgi:hypothetical protein
MTQMGRIALPWAVHTWTTVDKIPDDLCINRIDTDILNKDQEECMEWGGVFLLVMLPDP